LRILIVEDEENTSELYKNILAGKGECVVVRKGQEAIDAFNRSIVQNMRFDLILLDVSLPDITGLDVLEIIREKEKRQDIKKDKMIPVLMITGKAEKELILKAISLHCAGYIIKPVDRTMLLEKIDSVMKKRRGNS